MLRARNLALFAIVCLTLCGCGGSNKPTFKYKIAVIPKGMTHEFWKSIERGAKRAGADLTDQGVSTHVEFDGPKKEDEAKEQIEIVERSVSDKVSGIVLAPQHSKTMVAPVERAVGKGIPLVIIDSGLNKEEAFVKYVATNNYNGGELAAKHLLKALSDEGKNAPRLILFRYQVGSESTDQREQGFIDHVNKVIEEQKKEGKAAITWVSDKQYAGATKDSAIDKAMPLLSEFRDKFDGIFAPNESSAAGLLEALRSQRLNQKVKFVGFDSSGPLLDALKQGDIDGLIVQDPYKMGYLGVWILVQYIQGYDVSPDGEKELGTGEHLITKENVNSAETRELIDPELQQKRKIEVPKYTKRK
jgi:ribose transport system substrate-binding protein